MLQNWEMTSVCFESLDILHNRTFTGFEQAEVLIVGGEKHPCQGSEEFWA